MWVRTGGCAVDAAVRRVSGHRVQACLLHCSARSRHVAHRRAVLAALANTDEATLAAPVAADVFGQARLGTRWHLSATALVAQKCVPQQDAGSHTQAAECALQQAPVSLPSPAEQ